MWFAINQGLSTLQNLARQIDTRGADKLDSVSDDSTPTEIKTISNALNQLLSRLKKALAVEKRITSDAAHELRTPLSAVKIHAELAQSANNEKDRKNSIAQILLGIDRTTHLVDQILALARLEPASFGENLQALCLTRLVIDEVAMLVPLSHKKDIDISVSENEDLMIYAEDTSLRALVRNLLNNAVSYTQQGGTIEVFLSKIENKACLVIKDNGPGIPAAEREQVLQRFYRVENHHTPGCGIGLSIVIRVVELLNASFKMEESEPGRGLKVTVCFSLVK